MIDLENQKQRMLNDREKARTKLPVFYGSYDNFTHALIETLANGRDEIINNFERGIIEVTLYDDMQTLEVLDTGRGIPLMGETDGVKNYVLLFETLFAGGNFDNLGDGKITTGQNGCGFTCLNYTSILCEITSYKNNKAYKVSYKDGGIFQTYEVTDSEIEHGTRVKWKLDDTVYTKITYDVGYIKDILNKLSSTTDKVTYIFKHKDEVIEYKYETTLEYMKENAKNSLCDYLVFREKTYTENIKKEGINYIEKDAIRSIISLSTEPLHETYLNGTYLREHGTILDGIIDGLRKVFDKEVKKSKITAQDILMSFNIHTLLDSTNPIFNSQTKFSASNHLYKKIASKYIVENMETIKAENPKVYEEMRKHIEQINSFNTKNNDKVKKLKTILTEKVSTINRVKKFVDCRTKDKTRRELFIVEGDSALGSCKLGRNAEFQGIMPVRGKILNCLKANLIKVLDSEVIVDLMRVLGCGIEVNSKKNKDLHSFNLENLNWDKVIICTDADVDGYQIRTLILTMIYALAPTLIREGKVYIVETPLYEIEPQNGESIFVYSDSERDIAINQLTCKYKIHRSKGLGENDPDMMWHTTMNPETRKLIRVKIDDVEKMQEKFELLLGDEVAPRKKHIEEHGHKYVGL